jgi:hypothetical protein
MASKISGNVAIVYLACALRRFLVNARVVGEDLVDLETEYILDYQNARSYHHRPQR